MDNTIAKLENVKAKLENVKAKGNKTFYKVLLYIVLTLVAIVLMFPYLFMVSKSLMTSEETVDPTIRLFPAVLQFNNYVTLFVESNYLLSTLHTLIIVLFNLIAVPFSASIVAFSFAKLRWKGRNFMFAIMLGTMMLPSVVTQLPLYVMFTRFGWIDTLYPFTIPNLFGGGAIYIFLIRQFMLGIPKDMDNAAKIDGANTFTRFIAITLPLCKSVLIFIMVQVFIAYWGDYYGPLMYMHSSNAPKTLAYMVFLNSTEQDSATYMAHMRMAGGVFMSLIPAILFSVFQKQLIEGVVMSGIKG